MGFGEHQVGERGEVQVEWGVPVAGQGVTGAGRSSFPHAFLAQCLSSI